jgi:hypothetical protein
MTAALRRAAFCALLLITLEASPVLAHCDTLAGPVVTSARAALEQRNLQPLLKWVKPGAEAELKSAFDITLRVRTEGGAARELADRYFFETAVRLHRAGEGAPYTGLKVEAYVDYVHYVEALQQLVVTAGAGQSVHRHDK